MYLQSNQNNSIRISGLDDNNINNSTVNREQITITQQVKGIVNLA